MEQILVIDDDIYIGDILETALKEAGYSVLRAYSGTEALLLLEKETPALVLLDLMLPGLSGEDLLPKMQGIPVIVVSAKACVDDKVNLLTGGAVDYVTKPFEIKELLARIATNYGFIDKGVLVKEISKEELERTCKKALHVVVNDTKKLLPAMDRCGIECNVISDTEADIFSDIAVSELVRILDADDDVCRF